MALFRGRLTEDVVSKLDLALPGGGTIARSSVSQARDRLVSEPMKWLFENSTAAYARGENRDPGRGQPSPRTRGSRRDTLQTSRLSRLRV